MLRRESRCDHWFGRFTFERGTVCPPSQWCSAQTPVSARLRDTRLYNYSPFFMYSYSRENRYTTHVTTAGERECDLRALPFTFNGVCRLWNLWFREFAICKVCGVWLAICSVNSCFLICGVRDFAGFTVCGLRVRGLLGLQFAALAVFVFFTISISYDLRCFSACGIYSLPNLNGGGCAAMVVGLTCSPYIAFSCNES